ncbi:short-chain dehydrogenase [Pararhizobium polonicum]|uniref:Short-chain dehydrogenase n=1 Tax=Pararhizobium polonicum TaxID=1612624 RepID=A0A1C7P184_9HYPH|nr:SDR family oxidoreductase [Pararhizobium polonicum]OBZ94978.1 short-chain dehydrogenase [Pararhizobium polonicum]
MKKANTYAIIGGTSGMGFGLAQRLVERGDHVLVGGRSVTRLEQAAKQLGPAAVVRPVDMEDRASLAAFFDGFSDLAGLFTPGASYRTASFREADSETAESPFRGKFWAQYWAVHAALPHLAEDAAVLLMSGAASVRPIGNAAYAACNAAIEGLARALAVELRPIRVNCLSPGTIDSELWRNRPVSVREPVFEGWRSLALTGRVGSVDDAVSAALFLLDNGNMTGSTLYNDGGYSMR